jgi:hypothetical protein
MPPDGFHAFIECHLTKVFSIVVFASTGFDSLEARRTLFWQIIENQCCHCDKLIELMDRVKVIHGVCTGCHLMVFSTSQNVT